MIEPLVLRSSRVTCTLYHADCLDVLTTLTGIDAVVTDPPYGIEHKSNGQWFQAARSIDGDENLDCAEKVRKLVGDLPLLMFFSPYQPMSGWRSVLVWNKGAHTGIGGDRETCWKRDFELIGVANNKPLNGKRDSGVLNFASLGEKPTGHFCEKPVGLMIYLVGKLTQPDDCVCDPFLGSGTTGIACIREGRNFVGIEKDQKYFDIAAERIRNELAQTRLF